MYKEPTLRIPCLLVQDAPRTVEASHSVMLGMRIHLGTERSAIKRSFRFACIGHDSSSLIQNFTEEAVGDNGLKETEECSSKLAPR